MCVTFMRKHSICSCVIRIERPCAAVGLHSWPTIKSRASGWCAEHVNASEKVKRPYVNRYHDILNRNRKIDKAEEWYKVLVKRESTQSFFGQTPSDDCSQVDHSIKWLVQESTEESVHRLAHEDPRLLLELLRLSEGDNLEELMDNAVERHRRDLYEAYRDQGYEQGDDIDFSQLGHGKQQREQDRLQNRRLRKYIYQDLTRYRDEQESDTEMLWPLVVEDYE